MMTKPEAAAILEQVEDEIIKEAVIDMPSILMNAMCILIPGWKYHEWESKTIAEFVFEGLE